MRMCRTIRGGGCESWEVRQVVSLALWHQASSRNLGEFLRGKVGSGRISAWVYVAGDIWHRERDLVYVVYVFSFTFSGFDEDLIWIESLIQGWFEIKVRAKLGPDDDDDNEVTKLARTSRWKALGIEYEADDRHRKLIMDYFGFNDKTKGLTGNGNADIAE